MTEDETFFKKLEANITATQAELFRFKILGMGFTAGAKDRHDKHVEQFELKIDHLAKDLRDLSKENKKLSNDAKTILERRWNKLQTELQNAFIAFKTEPGVAAAHGGDEGPYPYGEGLSSVRTVKK